MSDASTGGAASPDPETESSRDAAHGETGPVSSGEPTGDGLGTAPALLDHEDERRRRDVLRAALFGDTKEAQRIGRFVLLKRLGAGGMGVVYAARDEQLERDVAVKLLRSPAESQRSERDRLLREAQAMAKLTHPNVVTVHEVGFHRGQLFVAMELVRGKTLAAWLRESPRSLQVILDVFLQAGKGLAAAHAAGLVHRDFKPENVMIDEEGLVKVLDFGLARLLEPSRRSTTSESAPGQSSPSPSEKNDGDDKPARPSGDVYTTNARASKSALEKRLTETGALMGTPAYMAPEQFLGEDTDARTDQYAFCVSLFEALYKTRPFEGGTVEEIGRAVTSGKIVAPPSTTTVPVWMDRVIRRGLSVDPAQRWPSMSVLLNELARDPLAKRKRRARAAAAIVVGAGAIAMTAILSRSSASPVCEGAKAEIEKVWNRDARDAVKKGILKSNVGYAADTGDRVVTALNKYAENWAEMHRQTCLASARAEQSAEMLDLKMGCLDRRRGEVRALVASLSDGSPKVAERAVSAVENLSPLASCTEVESLKAAVLPPTDPAVFAAVEAVRANILDAEADDRTGSFARGKTRATEAISQAEKTGYRPLLAEAHYQLGALHISLAEYDAALREMETAYFEALATGNDPIAAHASRQMYTILGYHLSKKEPSLPWEKTAEAFVSRVRGRHVLAADFLNTRALVRTEEGRLDDAAADYKSGLQMYESALGPNHLKVALLLGNMAQVAYLRGQPDESARALERAIAIREAAFGPDHPDVASLLSNLSLVRMAQGKVNEAIVLLERGLASVSRALGPENPQTTFYRNNLGDAYLLIGRVDVALDHYKHALTILEADKTTSKLRFSRSKNNIGWALVRGRKFGEAKPLLEASLATRREELPANHPDIAGPMLGLGLAELGLGNVDQAKALVDEALTMIEKARGPEHPDVAAALVAQGRVYIAKGDTKAAVVSLSRAHQIVVSRDTPLADRAEIAGWLARALFSTDREKAVTLGRQALADYRSFGEAFHLEASELERALGIGNLPPSPSAH